MWNSGFSTEGATFKWIQKLIKIRKTYVALRRGAAPVFRFTEDRAGILAFERTYAHPSKNQEQTVLAVFNTDNSEPRSTERDGEPMQTGFPPNFELQDALTKETFTTDSMGRLSMQLAPNSARILVPKAP